jgi:hypothetical protein
MQQIRSFVRHIMPPLLARVPKGPSSICASIPGEPYEFQTFTDLFSASPAFGQKNACSLLNTVRNEAQLLFVGRF